MKTKILFSLLGAMILGMTLQGFGQDTSEDPRIPDLPAVCGKIKVEEGNTPAFHVYATGVQVYRWNGTAWDFVEPVASLYADANYGGNVGSHYAGPIWESNSGSQVKGSRVDGCDVDPVNAIPWLLLKKVWTDGSGIFKGVTFIQRVNTAGGAKPSDAGTTIGEIRRVPYTAEYYFYRSEGPSNS